MGREQVEGVKEEKDTTDMWGSPILLHHFVWTRGGEAWGRPVQEAGWDILGDRQ